MLEAVLKPGTCNPLIAQTNDGFFLLIDSIDSEAHDSGDSVWERSMELPTIVGILAIIKFVYDMTKERRSSSLFKKTNFRFS
jgi:hypothetical protein